MLGIITHILELKENNSNISSKMVNKTVAVTVTDLTKMHETPPNGKLENQ